MLLDIKCIRSNMMESFKKNMETELELFDIQTYFPILDNYFNIYNFQDCHTNFVLNSRYILKDIITSEEGVSGMILDTKDNITQNKNIFIKENPLLEPVQYMQNKYQKHHNNLLPYSTYYMNKTINKLKLKDNSAYVDSFFVYIASSLVEKNILPSFPLYYGSYCTQSADFEYDISEEYNTFKKESWFHKNIDRLFELNKVNDYKDDIDVQSIQNCELSCLENDSEDEDEKDIIKSETESENSFVEEDCLDNIFNDEDEFFDFDMENEINEVSVIFKNYPTQIIVMEELDGTMEEIMLEENDELESLLELKEENVLQIYYKNWKLRCFQHRRYKKWLSMIFQICFCLAFLQKKFNFTHNDLHCDNIMYSKTDKEYLYYNYNNTYFKIPTYGIIIKIIDFGRSVYKVDNIQYFSDVFKYNSDAGGQYTHPSEIKQNKDIHYPNYSFDLCRLSTTIINELYPLGNLSKKIPLYNVLLSWITDKYNKNVMRFDDFDLYKIISRRMNNAVPSKYINHQIFKTFKINKDNIRENELIYRFL